MRIVSVHAHFWDVFPERPVSHHARAFQTEGVRTLNLAILKYSISFVWSTLMLTLLLCFGSSSCWMTLLLRFRSQTDVVIFCRWYISEFSGPSVTPIRPDPEAAKQPRIIILPPRSFSYHEVWRWYVAFCVLALHSLKCFTFVSSIHKHCSKHSEFSDETFFYEHLDSVFLMVDLRAETLLKVKKHDYL